MTVGSQQGDQKLRDKPSSEGGEKLKDFRMIGGEALTEVRGEVRHLPIEGPTVRIFDIPIGLLGAGAHTFF